MSEIMNFGKIILGSAVSAVVACVIPATVQAVPVVPNFQQGSMTSHTETDSTVTETINSIDYRTGWEYSVTGVGISNNGEALNPNVNTSTVTVTPSTSATATNGAAVTGTVTSSYDSLDFSQPSQFTISTPGEAFQFTQSYQGPGMTNQTIIQRVTTIKSVTDTTSTFTQ
tara:strand:- start:12270 stop:12779 length:510 start_codon:yes stop_codon:yes gene_type:complete